MNFGIIDGGMIILIATAAFLSTLFGGLFALKLKDKLHLILGFSAGAVIAAAFFDLIPESLNLGNKFYGNGTILTFTAIGFLLYLVLDRIIFLHSHSHSSHESHECEADYSISDSKKERLGIFRAASLCSHSFLDGMAVGLAFQVSSIVGVIVAVAVLTHDFSDGINTVSMILRGTNDRRKAMRWLFADAAAPVLGIISTLFFAVPEKGLSIILALFAGFFLYIGASDLIPESHHAHPKFLTTFMTLLGAGVLYVVIYFAGV
ncbi:MAG: ZIP family metal transporter [Patescibacteria group bacterium]